MFKLDTEYVCYDDACHLRRYANNPARSDLTFCTRLLSKEIEIVVDKMHMAGHTDDWCHKHCNPRSFKDLENVGFALNKLLT